MIMHPCHQDLCFIFIQTGQEFLSAELEDYCALHGIRRTTTQGYDPSSNGAAESAVGMLKRRARYLLSTVQLTTRWWGMAILAAAHLFRVDAGHEEPPKIPFGTRIMARLDPPPQNSFLPTSMPGVAVGPCDTIPGGIGYTRTAR